MSKLSELQDAAREVLRLWDEHYQGSDDDTEVHDAALTVLSAMRGREEWGIQFAAALSRLDMATPERLYCEHPKGCRARVHPQGAIINGLRLCYQHLPPYSGCGHRPWECRCTVTYGRCIDYSVPCPHGCEGFCEHRRAEQRSFRVWDELEYREKLALRGDHIIGNCV
jgi:hypothetical protein